MRRNAFFRDEAAIATWASENLNVERYAGLLKIWD